VYVAKDVGACKWEMLWVARPTHCGLAGTLEQNNSKQEAHSVD
jgi:hypothetical protein